MAIKVASTTVINNSRKLENVTDMVGTYGDFFPNSTTITTELDFTKPRMTLNMSGNVTFTATGFLVGRASNLILDRSTSGHTPSFPASIEFSPGTPTWADHRYWIISFLCTTGSTARAFAVGYNS
jgi:hypothetical protein